MDGLLKPNDMVYNQQGGTPWHKKGISLAGAFTAEDALQACPAFAATVDKIPATFEGRETRFYWTVREDTRDVLGVVGDEYTVLQNAEMLRLAEAFVQDPNGPIFETVGVLWGGRKSWVLAKFPDDMIIRGRNRREDVIGQYLLFSNAHDGSQKARVQLTPIRVVCQNTLAMAHGSKNANTSAYVCHSGDVTAKLTNVAELLGIAQREFAETKELYEALVNVEPSKNEIDTVLTKLFAGDGNRAKIQRERVAVLAENGRGNASFAGTGWAVYNGVTELVDHVNNTQTTRDDADDFRTNTMWFGSGAKFKAEALKVCADTFLN